MKLGFVALTHGTDLVGAVQDHFGPAFAQLSGQFSPGEIAAHSMDHQHTPSRIVGEGSISPLRFRIVRKVHPNTVYATLRKIGKAERKLARGNWYEVHSD